MRPFNSTSKESLSYTSSVWTLLWLLSAKLSETGLSLVCLLVEHSYWIDDPIVLSLKRTTLSNFRDVRDKTSKQDWNYWSALLENFAKDFPGRIEVSSASVLFLNWIQNISRYELVLSLTSKKLFKCISPSINYFIMAWSFIWLSKYTDTSPVWTFIWMLSITTFSFSAVFCYHLPQSRFLKVSDGQMIPSTVFEPWSS